MFEFGDFRLDTGERLLLHKGDPVPLPPKVFDTLVLLVSNNGRLLNKEQFMKALWPDTFVEDVNLSVNISVLRKTLGESKDGLHFIDTVPKRGYRFVAAVKEIANDEPLIVENHLRARVVTEEVESTQIVGFKTASTEPITETPTTSGTKSETKKVSRVAIVLLLAVALGSFYFWRLRSNSAEGPNSNIGSIAVLPFHAIDSEGTNQYLELGIPDDLINRLSGLKQLVIRPTSAVKKYSTVNSDPVTAGKELNVEAVVQGDLQKVGDRLRVTVNLIAVSDGRLLWSGKFEEDSKDVFAIEDSISKQVAEELTQHLTGEEQKSLLRRDVESPEAHEAYLKGRYFWNRRTDDGLNQAIRYFQAAIDIAPNYALAYAGIADSYALLYDYDMLPPSMAIPKARAAAQKAIALDPTLADPYCSLASIEALYDWDWAQAENDYRTAIKLNPENATAHHWYALALAYQGRLAESLTEIKRAQSLDPLSLAINSNLGRILYFNRKYDQAIQQLKYTLQLDENFWGAHYKLAEVYSKLGRYDEALTEYARSEELEGDKEMEALLLKRRGAAGYHQAVDDWLAKLKERAQQRHVSPFAFAVLYTDLGNKDEALRWLEKAAADHSSWIVLINSDPRFDTLRAEPRFQRLLELEGLSH